VCTPCFLWVTCSLISRNGAWVTTSSGWAGVHAHFQELGTNWLGGRCPNMSKHAYLEKETFQLLIDMFALPVLKGRHSILLKSLTTILVPLHQGLPTWTCRGSAESPCLPVILSCLLQLFLSLSFSRCLLYPLLRHHHAEHKFAQPQRQA